MRITAIKRGREDKMRITETKRKERQQNEG